MAIRRSASAPAASVHRLKVTLRGSKPPIWRRIVVPSDITLGHLHGILQDTMGWDDSHLHEFTIDDISYADPDMVEDFDEDETQTLLADVAPTPGKRFRYMYDFGDSWDHEILVEAVSAPDPGMTYPACLTGKRACPPDDVGGIWRYNYLVSVMADPNHPDYKETKEWLDEWWGEPLDPEAIDLAAINQRLAPGR